MFSQCSWLTIGQTFPVWSLGACRQSLAGADREQKYGLSAREQKYGLGNIALVWNLFLCLTSYIFLVRIVYYPISLIPEV